MSSKGSLLLPTLSGSLPRTSNLLTVTDTAEGPQNPTGSTFVTDEELKHLKTMFCKSMVQEQRNSTRHFSEQGDAGSTDEM